MRQLSKTLTRDLIQPLALFNTTLTRVPQFVFDDTEPEDMALYADALPKLASVMDIPAEWARRKLKIPTPAKDEPVLRAGQSVNSAAVAGLRSSRQQQVGCGCGGAVAALKAGQDIDIQTAIDRAATQPDGLQAQVEGWLQPVVDRATEGLQAGLSAEAVLAGLMQDFPLQADGQLIQALAHAMLVADLAGQWEAQQDSHGQA